jgi:site-specific recombinase
VAEDGSSLTGAALRDRLGEKRLSASALQALCDRLEGLPEPAALTALPLADLTQVLAPLTRWALADAAKGDDESLATLRVRTLLRVLELQPGWRARLAALARRVLDEVDFVPMLEIALPNDRGLYHETMERLARALLPRPRDGHNGRMLLGALIPDRDAAIWLAAIPPELARGLAALAGPGAVRFGGVGRALDEAIVLLATRISAIGLGEELRERSPAGALAASPFYLLPRLCDAMISGVGSSASCFEQISAAREIMRAILAHLDEFGVSVDVVYRLEVIEQNLDRLVELVTVRDAGNELAGLALVGRLSAAQIRNRSLRDVVRTNGRLLARKIVERAGSTGEHYITTTRKEWLQMLAAGAGGGVVTIGTTALKYAIVALHLPLFGEGLAASLNYAGSFLFMQLCGFALATKQPSMIAASLAGSLKSARRDVDLTELVELITRICRSQLAAVVGNVALGFAGGIAFELLWSRFHGAPFLSTQKAAYTLHSLDPLHSLTIWFGFITGVFLWLSSLGAGWLENFFVYRRVPDGIAQHPLGRVLGRERMHRLAARVQHAIGGVGGNVTIGFLLGMMPVIGAFFGIPLEVRHVTLSSVSLAMAIASHGWMGLVRDGVDRAALGILFILLLNFGVSFTLALWVAMRARGVRNQGLRLIGALWRRFYHTPLDFIRPPKQKG